MIEAISGKCVQWKMFRPRRISLAAMLVALTVAASAPSPASAQGGMQVEGAFSVMYAYPSAVDYCAGLAPDEAVSIQAQGLGQVSGLGALFITVQKCLAFADWTYTGSVTLSAANGDVLYATYAGTQHPADGDGFGPFDGVLTVTGGTGKFRNATGQIKFDAVAGPDLVNASGSALNGLAFYRVRGTVVPGPR